VAGARFCLHCGIALIGTGATVPPTSVASSPAAVIAERRLVTVLFADLVGFTSLSEHRDPEAVRELLSDYFERCRTLIERYGGTVEKFIGDAVMAVWGSPVAREDDAERAVRAALSLTQAVTLMGEEVGMPELRVRAGVLTGSAAVEVGSEGEGMVLGDTVNTASRLQSIAAPGRVLVDDVTRRATEASIEYDDAGVHAVKGRERPVRAWTALRVVAGVRGARRSAGLEAPFVGRDGELQTIVEVAEDTVRRRTARLVTITGDAGSGKSRRERRLVQPRLAQLLGLEHRSAGEAADLFSGWRLFFERMADTQPVILAFEDLQWADSGLLDFIDYLLEWSADHPIFSGAVYLLARCQYHCAALLGQVGRGEEAAPLLREAHARFRTLRAGPWVERVEALLEPVPTP
jgi:class 3 adenylate cyclase